MEKIEQEFKEIKFKLAQAQSMIDLQAKAISTMQTALIENSLVTLEELQGAPKHKHDMDWPEQSISFIPERTLTQDSQISV